MRCQSKHIYWICTKVSGHTDEHSCDLHTWKNWEPFKEAEMSINQIGWLTTGVGGKLTASEFDKKFNPILSTIPDLEKLGWIV